MLLSYKYLSNKTQILTFSIFTLATLAVYFEHLAGLAFVLFLVSLIWLSLISKDSANLSFLEKNWVIISALYSIVLIASFFVHLPVTDDGVWRLSSYGFILLMLWVFVVVRRQVFTVEMFTAVIMVSVLSAVLVFAIEWIYFGQELFTNKHIRLGHYAAIDYGGFSFFAMTTLILLIALAGQTVSTRVKTIALIGIALMFVFVLLSKGRSSIWYFPVVLLGLTWFFYSTAVFKFNPVISRLFIPVSILILVVAGVMNKDRINETFNDLERLKVNDYTTSLGERVIQYKVGWDIVNDHPILGVGLNHFTSSKQTVFLKEGFSQVPDHVQSRVVGFTQTHNQFLMDAIFAGVFGFIMSVVFIFYPLYMYIMAYIKEKEKGKKLIAMVGVLIVGYIIFTSLFGSVFTYTYTTIYYMLVNIMLFSILFQRSNQDTISSNLEG